MNTVDIVSPADFFRDRVNSAAQMLKLELDDEIEFYLVNLLCEFINPTQLAIDESMDILATPLALMLKKAIESSPDMQIKVYKRLGDTSLYLAGYFPAYFNRKTYDLAYYIDMGTAAYEQTSALMRAHKNDRHFSKVYSGLAQDFHKLVNIITELSESTPVTQDQDLIMAYKRWQSNKSGTLRRVLAEEGIKPIPSKDKASQ